MVFIMVIIQLGTDGELGMGHGALGMGHGALGMGHGAWGIGNW
ncbi:MULTISPECIES: hypothetical protein [unclassified Microcoleus]